MFLKFKKFVFKINNALSGWRLDRVLSVFYKQYTRMYINKMIRCGYCTVNNVVILKPCIKINSGDIVCVKFYYTGSVTWLPDSLELKESILDIIYEDHAIIVINKPSDTVVHPGNGIYSGTVVNILLSKYPFLCELPRAGVVHRLDKDTTGIFIIAKNIQSYYNLILQFRVREVLKTYLAIVSGNIQKKNLAIMEYMYDNIKDSSKKITSSISLTYIRIDNYFRVDGGTYSYIRVYPKTGRKHQIRKHFLKLGCYIVGDSFYKNILYRNNTTVLKSSLNIPFEKFDRVALHSNQLLIIHPIYKRYVFFETSLPKDMLKLYLNII